MAKSKGAKKALTAASVFARLDSEADAWFARENAPLASRRKSRAASIRYKHQGFELTVEWPGDKVDEASTAEAV